ncbi:MAG: hypothetical protein ACT6FG_00330 [Methanosarcinaceae archaeon]
MSLTEEYNDSVTVAANMQKEGGCFVKHLGQALDCADPFNIQKIKKAFPEYWTEYLDMGTNENNTDQED